MLVDVTRLEELRDLGGDDFVTDLWRVFLQTCFVEVPRLTIAIDGHAYDEVSRLAHLLKSASENVGASGFARVVALIEKAPAKDLPSLKMELLQLHRETLASEPALKAA